MSVSLYFLTFILLGVLFLVLIIKSNPKPFRFAMAEEVPMEIDKKKVEAVEDDEVAEVQVDEYSLLLNKIKESAEWFKAHYLHLRKQSDRIGFGYSPAIKNISPEYITPEGCRILVLLGLGIKGYDPINIAAGIHQIENRNCPNGLMPVLALVLMKLSDYKLPFNDSHAIICAFARARHKNNEKQGTANLEWLHLWTKKGDTADMIFKGR